MLTLSRVMMPCDWIGIVTIRKRHAMDAVDQRYEKDQAGAARCSADLAQVEHHGSLVLLKDAHAGREQSHRDYCEHDHDVHDHVDSVVRTAGIQGMLTSGFVFLGSQVALPTGGRPRAYALDY